MDSSLICQLPQVSYKNLKQVGGKAASLGEMLQVGMPVPPGYVVTTKAFHAGMSGDVKKAILSAFDELGVPRVAVRSSAIAEDSKSASWAGQLESYLNISREGLIQAVEDCWASIRSEHATEYGVEHGVRDDEKAVAVVVQAMVSSDISGVLFTANPVTQDRNELLIEAAFGLGELLVQGEITPESMCLSKDGKLISRQPSQQRVKLVYKDGANRKVDVLPQNQIVSENLLKQLVDIASKIEQHNGTPQDIEWAVEDGRLYIVQSRPITTLPIHDTQVQGRDESSTFFKVYTRDICLITQEAWYYALGEGVEKLLGWRCPHHPMVITYLHDGYIEVWQNGAASSWYLDELLAKNTEDPSFLKGIIEDYSPRLRSMQAIWKEGPPQTVAELDQFIRQLFEYQTYFALIYFSAYDERTPPDIRALAQRIRDNDVSGDTNDSIVRDSLKRIYSISNGLETAIQSDEIHDLPNKSALTARHKNYAFTPGELQEVATLNDLLRTHPHFIFLGLDTIKSQTTLSGSTAYPGCVRGAAQVIMRKNEVASFREGNILVAPMTTPHYLPAMRKAKAFVTDEGGVTCHAAIVAREMKTPCIIGTKIATQVLVDEDVIEVDADQGVVRIVERANTKNSPVDAR